MSTDTPNLPCGHHHSLLIKSVESDYTVCELCDTRSQRNDAIEMERKYRVENARLREEVEMLNVRHAAAMLHAQTHADEYNALREDEKGLLQDIQRLTEEAFKRDEELALTTGTLESRERNIATLQEELAEAKRDTGLAKLVIQQKQDQIASAEAALEQAEARALAAEKDAGRYRLLRSRIEVPGAAAKFLALNNWHPSTDLHDLDAAIDAAIAGAKHEH